MGNANRKKIVEERHGNDQNADLVLEHILPGMLDLATATVARARSDCQGIVQDQVYKEYVVYANKNRTSFIRKLAKEAWPQAEKDVKKLVDLYRNSKKAECDKKLKDYERRKKAKCNKNIKNLRDAKYKDVLEETRKIRDRELARDQEWRLKESDAARANMNERLDQYQKDEKARCTQVLANEFEHRNTVMTNHYRALYAKFEKHKKEEEARCDEEILNERKHRQAVMRASLDDEFENERKLRISKMEEEFRRMRAMKFAEMESELAAARSNMVPNVTDDAVTGPGTPVSSSVDGGNTSGEDSSDLESDTSLVNDRAKSPGGRGRTSRGMYFRSPNHVTAQAVPGIKYADSSIVHRSKAISLRFERRAW